MLQAAWAKAGGGGDDEKTPLVSTGADWIVTRAFVREGLHTPYRYVLDDGGVRVGDEAAALGALAAGAKSPAAYVKELRVTTLEGMSTRLAARRAAARSPPVWLLSMSLVGEPRALPAAFLCGAADTAQMRPLADTPQDSKISYRLDTGGASSANGGGGGEPGGDLGSIIKVRLRTGGGISAPHPSPLEGAVVHIKKMRLCDTANGDEVRFPCERGDFKWAQISICSTSFQRQTFGSAPTRSSNFPPSIRIARRLQVRGGMRDVRDKPCGFVVLQT